VHREDGTCEQQGLDVRAIEPQRDAPDQEQRAEEGHPDRQPQGQDLHRTQFRDEDLRRDEGPSPEDDRAQQEPAGKRKPA
jgi:hypothetical protein